MTRPFLIAIVLILVIIGLISSAVTPLQAATPTPRVPSLLIPSATPGPAQTTYTPPNYPSPLCALIDARVICYDRLNARARPIFSSPPDQAVTDFAVSPTGGWLVYRLGASLIMAEIGGAASLVIDKEATAPALITPAQPTIAWARDGIGLAYLTEQGVRTIYPGGQIANKIDRPYIQVRWSIGGARLAAQSSDGGWTFFESKPGALTLTRTFNQPAEAAWLDDDTVVIAPVRGGLLRLDTRTADAAPLWYIADEMFIKLNENLDGDALALHPDRKSTFGYIVSIKADGKWAPLGTAKLDSRLAWASADWLYYITDGTPVLVERATGAEDALPFRPAARVAFGPAALPTVLGVTLDADLYFLARDTGGISQLWRLSRTGFPLVRISQSVIDVTDYAVLSDKIQYVAGVATVTVNLDGTLPDLGTPGFELPTRVPPPTATSVPTRFETIGWNPGPSVLRRIEANGTVSKATLLEMPLASPSGRYAVGTLSAAAGSQLVIIDWTTGRKVAIDGIGGATRLLWVS